MMDGTVPSSDTIRHATIGTLGAEAQSLADRLPRLMLEARRIAMTILAGQHGRRRSGPGETFWQFRPYGQGEAAQRIDWRRSARDGHLFVREREWEAAHTIWIWIDVSPSMLFRSKAALADKIDHGVICALALADLLVRGGERVGLWGIGQPVSGGRVIEQLGHQLLAVSTRTPEELPRAMPLKQRHELVLISDFLSPLSDWQQRITAWGGQNARGHALRIVDPVEETFPFHGQSELIGTEQALKHDIGDADAFRTDYLTRMAHHDGGLAALCQRMNWSWLKHHTDQPIPNGLLALAARIVQGSGKTTSSPLAEGF
jgi:uncharacterized protein (DUF58 family)